MTKEERIAELKEDLVLVKAAIKRSLNATEYTIAGRGLKRIDYKALLAERDSIRLELEQLEDTVIDRNIVFDTIIPAR